jgi:primosomal protein N' (replication factor Y)
VATTAPTGAVVRVLPDQTGLTKTFDYLVPSGWEDRIEVGTRVRVALGPRRVGAWVVETGVAAPDGVDVKPLAKVTGLGPSPELIDLARWARWRWAAKTPVPFLRTASPERAITVLPPRPPPGVVPSVADPLVGPMLPEALAGGPAVLRLPPTADLLPVVQGAAALGDALVICPSHRAARHLAARLKRAGVAVALHPDEWARAAAGGCTVVGTRAAAWAPSPDLAAVVVLDEHDEVHQEERSPTWHARDVVVERARRRGLPCVLTSPVPSLEALAVGRLVRADRASERAGWPAVVVADRSEEPPGRNALFSPQLVDVIRSGATVVCVLNQKGRAALLACTACGQVGRCDRCGAAVHKPTDALVCRRCGETRPVICASCGSVDLKTIRMGVSRVVDDLAALTGEEVVAVTAETRARDVDRARLHVGTAAVLHQLRSADVVAFLDLDQELYAPRYRAAEEALGLIARAARLVGGRASGGRVLLQTRSPEHEVVRAVLLGDPERVSRVEDERRALLGLPPHGALAVVGDQAAGAFAAAVPADRGVQVQGPLDGTWRLRADDHATLCDVLAEVPRPPGRLRLSVDPMRL